MKDEFYHQKLKVFEVETSEALDRQKKKTEFYVERSKISTSMRARPATS